MFKFMQSPAYWWPVDLRVAADDAPGTFVTTTIEVQFARKTVAEQDAWLKDVRTGSKSDVDFLQPLVVGFRKVFDADDAEVPFTPDTLAQLLDVPGAATAIARSYFDSNDKAAQKN